MSLARVVSAARIAVKMRNPKRFRDCVRIKLNWFLTLVCLLARFPSPDIIPHEPKRASAQTAKFSFLNAATIETKFSGDAIQKERETPLCPLEKSYLIPLSRRFTPKAVKTNGRRSKLTG